MGSSNAELEKRIEALEARDRIEETMNRYNRSADFGALEEWADCFMPDGTYETAYEDGHVESRATGTAELLKVVEASRRRNAGAGRHFIIAPDIVVDGDTATSTALMGTFTGIPDNVRLKLFGRYFDVLKQCADGRWRFVSRRSELQGRAAEFVGLASDGTRS
ncbi:MAG: hypothetical protein QOH08_936 [Chloroflexota bacterium]|jgi:hypothetical protein|nr:hypothetical protein [Chloroflexota bacterium]